MHESALPPGGYEGDPGALESHPKSDRLIFMRGVLYAMQDEFERRKQTLSFRRISHRRPILVMWASAFLTWRLPRSQAIEILHQRLRAKPNEQASFICWVRHCFDRRAPVRRYIEAQTSLESSVRINPICVFRTSPWGHLPG